MGFLSEFEGIYSKKFFFFDSALFGFKKYSLSPIPRKVLKVARRCATNTQLRKIFIFCRVLAGIERDFYRNLRGNSNWFSLFSDSASV